MKKRDIKSFFKDVSKHVYTGLNKKEKRVSDNATGKVNLPYKMLQGMKKKSLERRDTREFDDKQGRIIGESSRSKKLMQNHFEKKDELLKEEKRLRLDTSERGINWHQMSLGKYKNGTLHFSKSALERFEKGDVLGGAYNSVGYSGGEIDTRIGRTKIERKKHTYAEIMKKREEDADYMTGKRFKKARGSMGKIHQKFKPKKSRKK